jgi:hypothetical protein
VPQSNWGDLNGQINALDLGERRLHALLDEYGDETITAALAVLSSRADPGHSPKRCQSTDLTAITVIAIRLFRNPQLDLRRGRST